MKIFIKLSCVILAGLVIAGCQKGDELTCRNINKAIDDGIAETALLVSEQDSDRSAIQQNARDARVANELGVIQINLTLLAQNKCEPRTKPIVPDDYSKAAQKCKLSLAEARVFAGSSDPQARLSQSKAESACKFSNWSIN